MSKLSSKLLEKGFETEFGNEAVRRGCLKIKIPDVVINKAIYDKPSREALEAARKSVTPQQRGYLDTIVKYANNMQAHKRPFDDVLVTPNRTYCVELKVASGMLKDHQEYWLKKVNGIHPYSGIVIRRYTSNGGYLRVDFPNELKSKEEKHTFANYDELFKFLVNLPEKKYK
jgi:hypothetical protein